VGLICFFMTRQKISEQVLRHSREPKSKTGRSSVCHRPDWRDLVPLDAFVSDVLLNEPLVCEEVRSSVSVVRFVALAPSSHGRVHLRPAFSLGLPYSPIYHLVRTLGRNQGLLPSLRGITQLVYQVVGVETNTTPALP